MTEVCLVRHGETDWNTLHRMQGRENTMLNDNGRIQADLIGKYFKGQSWDVIVTSPLIRARETAEAIRKHTAINELHEMDEFVERDFGMASGLTAQEARALFPDGNILNIESFEILADRVMRGLDILLQKYENRKIIAVTHGTVINAVVSIVSGGEIKTTRLANACINLMRHDGDCWKCEVYNSTKHL